MEPIEERCGPPVEVTTPPVEEIPHSSTLLPQTIGRPASVYEIHNPTLINSPMGASDVTYHEQLAGNQHLHIEPTSINNIGQVTPCFIESKSYQEVKQGQQDKVISVLHLHGMPGSGKSETVRKLGADFPYNSESIVFAKWHIQCSDINHDIKTELKKLLECMVKHSMLLKDERVVESAIEHLVSNNRCKEYVDLLASSNFPILIILEDPNKNKYLEETNKLLDDFLLCIGSTKGRQEKFHVYITSQNEKTCILPSGFTPQKIVGLTPQEGLSLLGVTAICEQGEKDAAVRIIERLSGLPLGLQAVKAARSPSITFKMYLKNLEDDKSVHEIIKHEAKQLKVNHLHKAILMLLVPEGEEKDDSRLRRAILSLSLLHHGNIPQILIGRIMQHLRKETRNDDISRTNYLNRKESDELIKTLSNYGMCKVAGNDYMNKYVTFHEVVFMAVRLYLDEVDRLSEAVYPTIKSVAGIVHKDFRRTQNFVFMNDMIPHMRSVLKYCTEDENDVLLQLCCSHLYEVIGSVLGTQQTLDEKVSQAEINLQKSLTILFGILSSQTGADVTVDVLNSTFTDENVQKRAKAIVDTCTSTGKALFAADFDIENYLSLVLQPKQSEIDFYLKKSNDDVKHHFEIAMNNSIPLPPTKIYEFRNKSMPLFLEKNLLYETYLAERIVSVLHTLSRLLIYHKGNITLPLRQRFTLFSTIALTICEEVEKRFGIAPIFLRITATALVSIRMKGLNNFSESEKKNILQETKNFVQKNLMSEEIRDTLFYEHGILKKVAMQEFDFLTHLCSVVRINAKLASVGSVQNFSVEDSDRLSELLYDRAILNLEWGVSIKSLVYCGKYWAARKEYVKALDHFDTALKTAGIKSKAEITKMYPRTCYNHARAVCCGKLTERANKSKELCVNVLKRRKEIAKDLVEKLEGSVKMLEDMLVESAALSQDCE